MGTLRSTSAANMAHRTTTTTPLSERTQLLSMMNYLQHVGTAEYAACTWHALFADVVQAQYSHAAQTMLWIFVKRAFIQLQVVSRTLWWFAGSYLVALNFGCVYYIILKGVTKRYDWQRNFLLLFALSLLSDLFFVQVVEVIWVEVWLPSLIRNPLAVVKQQIDACLQTFANDHEMSQLEIHDHDKQLPLLSSTSSFSTLPDENKFFSAVLAARQPSLPTSQFVLFFCKQHHNQHYYYYHNPIITTGLPTSQLTPQQQQQTSSWLLSVVAVFPLVIHSCYAALTASILLA
jgi:hypothetical protein